MDSVILSVPMEPLVVGKLRRPITIFRDDNGRIRSITARLAVKCPSCGFEATHGLNLLDPDDVSLRSSHCGCRPYRVAAAADDIQAWLQDPAVRRLLAQAN